MFKLNSKGFTLLEVIIALIIITLSMGAIFQSLSRSKKIAWKTEKMGEVVRIMHNLLSDNLLMEKIINDKEVTEDVPGEDGWRYKASAEPLQFDEEDISAMHKLSFCLLYQDNSKEKTFCIDRWYRL